MELKVKKLHPDATAPKRAKPGDAGLDLTCIDSGEIKKVHEKDEFGNYKSAFYREYKTGIAMEIPSGYVGLIFPRSSISNTALSLANSVGVVDSGFRGEILLRFRVLQEESPIRYKKGDKIGQLIVMPYPEVEVIEVDALTPSARGKGGFGSSGK